MDISEQVLEELKKEPCGIKKLALKFGMNMSPLLHIIDKLMNVYEDDDGTFRVMEE